MSNANNVNATPAIAISGLDVRFGPAHVVHNLSMAISHGESYGIVGESGSGKSTVLRVLAGLNREWTGEISILGQKQPKVRGKAFFRSAQMVFQDPFGSLHPKQTVDDALSEPLSIHGVADAEAKIARALSDVGLPANFRYRYPHQLSGGQRQRVAIARALVLEPAILLLDEPTSALDVSIQAEILNLLQDLRHKRELTMVLVSHNFAVVGHMCERIAVMNGGRIVEETTVANLRSATVEQDYTRELLVATKGYVRAG
jgi:peptide/nickel transport system ATP-binding protein